jgi:hypothetical protein
MIAQYIIISMLRKRLKKKTMKPICKTFEFTQKTIGTVIESHLLALQTRSLTWLQVELGLHFQEKDKIIDI